MEAERLVYGRVPDPSGAVELAPKCYLPTSLHISPNGKLAALMCTASGVSIVDLDARKVLAEWNTAYPIHSFIRALSGGASQVAISDEGEIYLVDGSGAVQVYTSTGKPVQKLVSVGDDDWLVIDEAGRFDTSDISNLARPLKWRSHPWT